MRIGMKGLVEDDGFIMRGGGPITSKLSSIDYSIAISIYLFIDLYTRRL